MGWGEYYESKRLWTRETWQGANVGMTKKKKKEKKQKEINLFDTDTILWQLQGWEKYISCGNCVEITV